MSDFEKSLLGRDFFPRGIDCRYHFCESLPLVLALGRRAMLCLHRSNDVAEVAWINIRPAGDARRTRRLAMPALERLEPPMATQAPAGTRCVLAERDPSLSSSKLKP